MDDYSFHSFDFLQGDEFQWFDNYALPAPAAGNHQTRDFVGYSGQALQGFGSNKWGNHGPKEQNVHKRMIEFLKKRWESVKMENPMEVERERNHKHMINERMRRVKQKQCLLELHKLLPEGTKSDKNSIIQTAAETIEELRTEMEASKRRKLELEMALTVGADRATEDKETMEEAEIRLRVAHPSTEDKETTEEAEIRLRVAHPSSGIDSMLEVLKCLKNTGTKTKALQSNFTSQEFSAVLHIEAKMPAADVEKEVHKTLYEVERKFRCGSSSL